jgi:hypothetical protein
MVPQGAEENGRFSEMERFQWGWVGATKEAKMKCPQFITAFYDNRLTWHSCPEDKAQGSVTVCIVFNMFTHTHTHTHKAASCHPWRLLGKSL